MTTTISLPDTDNLATGSCGIVAVVGRANVVYEQGENEDRPIL